MTGADPEEGAGGRVSARWVLWLLVGIVGALGLALAGHRVPAPDPAGTYATAFGGPFTLTAPDGTIVSDRTLAGRPYAIYFGYTRCPDVCPTTLARLARLRQQLGRDGGKLAIIFVSVDPGHDKPVDIGRYVALFGTPILGLSGTPAQLARIEKGFGVYVRKVPQAGGDYTIDHTATVYLIGPRGEFVTTIDHDESDTAALEKLRRLVA